MPLRLIQENLKDAKLFASREDLIKSLVGCGINSVAELGVAYGDFSDYMIETLKPKLFGAYDVFMLHTVDVTFNGITTKEKFNGLTHSDFYVNRLKSKFSDNIDLQIFKGDSSTNLHKYNSTYDLIYIDGDHTLKGVWKDTNASQKKLSPGGRLIYNDYMIYDHRNKQDIGTVGVVNCLCVNEGWKITGMALQNEMYCDVMIEKR
jgi:hypothetical protein